MVACREAGRSPRCVRLSCRALYHALARWWTKRRASPGTEVAQVVTAVCHACLGEAIVLPPCPAPLICRRVCSTPNFPRASARCRSGWQWLPTWIGLFWSCPAREANARAWPLSSNGEDPQRGYPHRSPPEGALLALFSDRRVAFELLRARHECDPWAATTDEQFNCRSEPFI